MTDACIVCGEPKSDACETAVVRCNVRRFGGERFTLWRCAACRAIHALEDVDLAHYYAGYPIFAADLDWKLRVVYSSMLRRLRAAALAPSDRILDYGCGVGLLVRFLRDRGHRDSHGYDPYAPGYDDRDVLAQDFDCIVCQDVIEHVDDPRALISELDGLLAPGGIVSIGTPDADVLDLADPEDFIHELHAPYHRHVLTHESLVGLGVAQGWQVVRSYDTMYNNTLFPMMNPRFALHYVRCHDDTWDLVAEPPRISWKLLSPLTLLFAFFGYFFDRHTDVQVIFRKPEL